MSLLSVLKGNYHKKTQEELPLLPLQEIVLYPNTVVPIFITYNSGIVAVNEALRRDMRLFAACIRNIATGETYLVGTAVKIVQHLKLPDNTFRVVLQGEYRATISSVNQINDFSMISIVPIGTILEGRLSSEMVALMRTLQKSFAKYAESSKKIANETINAVEKTENPERLANLICNSLLITSIEQKIELLSFTDLFERLDAILEILERENEIFDIQKTIRGKIKSRIDKNQREYVLNEQLKEINKELGRDSDDFDDLEKIIEGRHPSEEALQKARKEIARLRKLQPISPEAGVLRGYLEWIADLPWSTTSTDSGDLYLAEKILNEDHFALNKAKERILEFIAILRIFANTNNQSTAIKGPILCFVGPPGTGKTSLGKSVARALGRHFVRISLGGLRDEAEIRGHRKTYVGALPGKIIQSMRKAGTINPVILLDEIDKLSSDFRGDPASALLEALDPEQNVNFTDHYLEVAYDLSKVLFITTANSLHTIPYPLLDRMEIIEIPGYGENEKLNIARHFLIPKQLHENGLSQAKIIFKDDTIHEIIRHWTMESGVRGLEREIARCIRRIARDAIKKEYSIRDDKPLSSFKRIIRPSDLEKLLGRRKYKNDLVFKEERIGVSYGLAWTEMGGTMMPVESSILEGSGELIITGNVGAVMKESARIALSYVCSIQKNYDFHQTVIKNVNIHLHVPEGAIPKDGPSAGITLATSIFSTLCRRAPKSNIAMTGELTLTGRILPIGGLKEKSLAAVRNNMEQILIPSGNKEEWEELDKEIKDSISVLFVDNAEDAFSILFRPKL